MKRLALLIALLLLAGCTPAPRSYPRPRPTPVTYRVRYEVEHTWYLGYAGLISYRKADGDSPQLADQSLPWKMEIDGEPGMTVRVSAQNGNDRGNITCRIFVNDVLVRETESKGAFTIATCSGRLPE